MRILKAMAALFCLTLLGAAFSLPALADDWDQQTQGQPTQDQPAVNAPSQSNEATNEAAPSEPAATSQPASDTEGQAASQQADSDTNQTQERAKELPKTASPLPLVALSGFLAASSGLGLRVLAKKKA